MKPNIFFTQALKKFGSGYDDSVLGRGDQVPVSDHRYEVQKLVKVAWESLGSFVDLKALGDRML